MKNYLKIAGIVVFCLLLVFGIYIGFRLGKKRAGEYIKKHGVEYRDIMIDSLEQEGSEIMGHEKLTPLSESQEKEGVVDYEFRKSKPEDVIESGVIKEGRHRDKLLNKKLLYRTNIGIIKSGKEPKKKIREKEFYEGFKE